jgi:hypothetical protein
VLLLEPDGLGVLTGGSSIRHLPFGTDAETVTRTLTATLGPVTRTTLPECGQGPRTQLGSDGFTVLVDGSRIVGWTDDGRSRPRLTTAAGIGVGSTLAAVRDVIADVEVSTDTLGPEWFSAATTMGGLLDGTAAGSRITLVYAGETCFFR